MPNLHLLTQTFSQARHASGTDPFNGSGPPLTLHQPGREDSPRIDRRGGRYLRAERQCFVKLPRTGAVLFSIHTYVVRLSDLTGEMRAGLEGARL